MHSTGDHDAFVHTPLADGVKVCRRIQYSEKKKVQGCERGSAHLRSTRQPWFNAKQLKKLAVIYHGACIYEILLRGTTNTPYKYAVSRTPV